MSQEKRRSNSERNKYGICLNDECPKCKGKEIQQISMRKEFVCAECGSDLRECPPPKKRNNKLIIIIAAVVIVLGGAIAAIVFSGNSEPTLLSLNKTQCELTIGECDTIVARITPIDTNIAPLFQSSDENVAIVNSFGVVRAIAEGRTNVTVSVRPRKGEPIIKKVTVIVLSSTEYNTADTINNNDSIEHARYIADSIALAQQTAENNTHSRKVAKSNTHPTSTSGGLTLSYGKYTGATRNGYPHGQGRLTYTSHRVINQNDPKRRTAAPGDYVIGEFFNGYVVYGKHYNAAGDLLESLNIGVGSESSYESR